MVAHPRAKARVVAAFTAFPQFTAEAQVGERIAEPERDMLERVEGVRALGRVGEVSVVFLEAQHAVSGRHERLRDDGGRRPARRRPALFAQGDVVVNDRLTVMGG